MRSWDDIVAIVSARKRNDAALKRAMIDVRDRVNGDTVLPLYDVEQAPITMPMAPQLVAGAIDSAARRAASTMPQIWVPAVNAASRRSVDRARDRRRALNATWADNRMSLILRKAFRQLSGYGTTAIVVRADLTDGRVVIEMKDPLGAYPEVAPSEDVSEIANCGFIVGRSAEWCMERYPYTAAGYDLRPFWRTAQAQGQIIDMLEWIDADDVVIGCMGVRQSKYLDAYSQVPNNFEIVRGPNRAGMVPVVCPQAVTIDAIATSVQRIIPAVDMLDRLMALETIAAETAVFPDRYVITRDQREPEIIGNWKDGRTGEMNFIANADGIGQMMTQINPGVMQVMSNLERAARLSSDNPSIFSGEANGSVRSGQVVNALGSFSVDPAVAEMQETMGAWLEVVNRATSKSYKAYFGARSFSMYSGKPGDNETVDFVPNELFEIDYNTVTYSWPGQDVNGITVAVAQLVGAHLISAETARARHPLIDDPEHETRQIEVEALEAALLTSLQQAAVAGSLPPADLARVQQLRLQGVGLAEAVQQAHKEAQERQATAAPTPEPGQVAAPETQPGLAAPGMGAEQPAAPAALPGPDQALQNFQQLAGALRRPVAAAGIGAR